MEKKKNVGGSSSVDLIKGCKGGCCRAINSNLGIVNLCEKKKAKEGHNYKRADFFFWENSKILYV